MRKHSLPSYICAPIRAVKIESDNDDGTSPDAECDQNMMQNFAGFAQQIAVKNAISNNSEDNVSSEIGEFRVKESKNKNSVSNSSDTDTNWIRNVTHQCSAIKHSTAEKRDLSKAEHIH